jgi:MoaA/NifB/PqqE/SkfB family radical SAM enzyme
MNSNGNLLGAEDAKKLIGSGLDAVYFGIDAARAETYERIRVGGNFQRTVDNIRGLVRLKKEMGADTPEVCVQFVEMDENEAEKGEFIDFWNQEGVKVKIRPKVSWAGMIDAPNLLLGNEERWPCHWAMQTLSVTDQGLVVTCAVDLDARLVAGDLNRQTIKEVWNGTLRDLRRFHLSGDYVSLPPHCRDCRDWQSARADYYQANP